MFLFRTALVLAIAFLVTADVNAQLFRFRRSAPAQRPGAYNARAYQYTQLQRPATNVPSERFADQRNGNPNCNRNQVVYVSAAGMTDEQLKAYAGKMVTLTLQDPQTGKLVQQPYIRTNRADADALLQKDTSSQIAAANKTEGSKEAAASSIVEKSPEEMLSKASTADLTLPALEAPNSKSVARTSFESPVLDSEKQYSVLDTNKKTEPAAASAGSSVLESSLPTLDVPAAQPILSREPGSILQEPKGNLDLDIDLPPLGSKGSN